MSANSSTHRSGRPSRARRALLLLATVFGCGGDKSVTGPVAEVPEPLAVVQAVARPSEVITARIHGATVPAGTSAGRLGTAPVTAGRLDDSTIALPVPAVVPGSYELRVRVGATLYAGTVQVAEPVVVAQPAAYVDGAIDDIVTVLDDAATRLAASPVGRTAADSARSVAALAHRRAQLDSVRRLMAAATPAEVSQFASFLKVNEQALGLAQTATVAASIRRAAADETRSATGAALLKLPMCYTDAMQPLYTPEECSSELDGFLVGRIAAAGGILAVLAGANLLERSPGAGMLVGLAGAMVAASQATVIYERTMTRFVSPVLTAFGNPEWLFGDGSSLRMAEGERGTWTDAAAALAGDPVFVAGRARPLVVQAEYRSLVSGDAAGGPGAALAARVGTFATVWDAIRVLLPDEAPAVSLPATPATTVTVAVSPQYLQLVAVAPAGLRSTVTPLGEGWSVAFDLDGIGRDHDITFAARYSPPGSPAMSATRTALLVPTKYAVAEVVIGGTGTGNVSKGGTLQLGVVVRDSAQRNLTDRAVTWSSSNTARARVDTAGKVTAVDTGTVTITATADGKAGTVQLRVTQPSVASIDLAPNPASVRLKDTLQLVATLKDSVGNVITGRTITWTSSAATIATVDTLGRVVGLAVGTATVTAASGAKTGSVQVKVSNVPVATIAISPANAELLKGSTQQMAATLRDSAGNILVGRELRWSSLSANVATVDSVTGWVSAIDEGTTLISAVSEGKTATVPLKVIVARATVASVTLEPKNPEVQKGSTLQLAVTQRDSAGNVLNGRPVYWYSADTNRVTIDPVTWVLTAKDTGWVGIAATAENGKNDVTSVHVTLPVGPVASVTVSPNPVEVQIGSVLQLIAVARDANGTEVFNRPVQWRVANTAIATIDAVNGGMRALAGGSTIAIATVDGVEGTATVNVSAPLRWASLARGANGPFMCGIAKNGNTYCWGNNPRVVGAGDLERASAPVLVNSPVKFTQLVIGWEHACGLTADNDAWCWGENYNMTLGDGTQTSTSTPVKVIGGKKFASLVAGAYHTCGREPSGVVSCWGMGRMLGDSTTASRGTPGQVAWPTMFSSISAHGGLTCGIAANTGRSYCWGTTNNGLAGGAHLYPNGTPNEFLVPTEYVPASADGYTHLVSSGLQNCGTRELGGIVYCTGVKDASFASTNVPFATALPPGNRLEAGGEHICSIAQSGEVWCFMQNGAGQAGSATDPFLNANGQPLDANGNPTTYTKPVKVTGNHSFVDLVGGSDFTCGIEWDGRAWCWGGNGFGQLGAGHRNNTGFTPVPIADQPK